MKTKTRYITCFAALLALISFSQTHGAPMPGTASSKLVSPQIGLYRSPLGFELNSGTSGWVHTEPPKDNKFVATAYRSPDSQERSTDGQKTTPQPPATLTVRVDKIKKGVTLEKYVQRWKKEYPKYGFDVLGAKAFTQNKQKAFVLDLINRDSAKQLRQVVFLKDQKAVILTCRDGSATFKSTLKDCNNIIKTFHWTE